MLTRHVTKSLARYCDGELSAPQVERVEAHLATCAQCRDRMDEIRFSARLVRELKGVSAPLSVWHGIDSALSEKPVSRVSLMGRWALAAVFLFAVVGTANLVVRNSGPKPWEVASIDSGATRRMAAGEWVETGAASKARIVVGTVGIVDVAPDSRVQLGQASQSEYRLALTRGTISAEINAPPRFFIVDTPASTVVDLGCAYTVTVGNDGAAELTMTSGWASLEFKGRQSLVPAGAVCRTKPGAGPGTPYFEDASPTLKQAIDDFDSGKGQTDALAVVIREARVRDTLTLWHLLSRVQSNDRERVYDRMAQLAPPPLAVSRERVLALDAEVLRKWREELAWKW